MTREDWFGAMSKEERAVIVRLTEVVCESIHREVCDPYVGGDHLWGGAHLPCEYNLGHGRAVWMAADIAALRGLVMVYRPVYEQVVEVGRDLPLVVGKP